MLVRPVGTTSEGGSKINVRDIPMLIRLHSRNTGGVVSVVESHDVPGGGA